MPGLTGKKQPSHQRPDVHDIAKHKPCRDRKLAHYGELQKEEYHVHISERTPGQGETRQTGADKQAAFISSEPTGSRKGKEIMSEEWGFDQGEFTGNLFPTSDSLSIGYAIATGSYPSGKSLSLGPAVDHSKRWVEDLHDTDAEADTDAETDTASSTINVVSISSSRYQEVVRETPMDSPLPLPPTTPAKRRTSDNATAGRRSKKTKVSPPGKRKSPKSGRKRAEKPVSETESGQNESGDLVVRKASAAHGITKMVLELEKRAIKAEQAMMAAEQRAWTAEEMSAKAEHGMKKRGTRQTMVRRRKR